MLSSFFSYLEFEKRCSSHTLSSYKHDLLQFEQHVAGTFDEKDLSRVSYPMIRSWLVSLVEDDLSAKTINRKIASLRSFYKFLLKKGHISKNPTLKIVAPKIKKTIPSFVDENQLVKLLDNFSFSDGFQGTRDKLVLELLYGTGIRLSELINIHVRNINFHDQSLKVKGKGNKERLIPINKSLSELIKMYIEERDKQGFSNDILLVTDQGQKTYPMFIYRMVKKYLSEVPTLEKKSPHVLRHTFATHLLNKGADLNAIKDLLGHSSLAATQVYTHNSMEKLKKIFDQAHPKA